MIPEPEWTALCLCCGNKLYTDVGEEGVCSNCGLMYIIVKGEVRESGDDEYDYSEDYY